MDESNAGAKPDPKNLEPRPPVEADLAAVCRELGINLSRAATVGVHPAFVSMIRELILERTEGRERRCLGRAGAGCDTCGPDCCPPPKRAAVKSAEAR